MRFHLPGLPGQPITAANSTCAFTQKVRKFVAMMAPRGHDIITYGDPVAEVEGAKHVVCYPELEEPPEFTAEAWETYNFRAVAQISRRAKPGDFVGLMGGNAQRPFQAGLPEQICVEYGIGYHGVFADFKVFESYAWMHAIYGNLDDGPPDGSFYDIVIPPYFEPTEHKLGMRAKRERDPYLLYIGRMEERKGVHMLPEVAKQAGLRMVLAGEGPHMPDGDYEHVGKVGPKERNKLMSEAAAVILPSIYVEPGGHAAIEAQLCGTPVISTDWGCFAETVQHGATGWRCRTQGEFVWAAKNLAELRSPQAIRNAALKNYSLEAIAPRYEAYFEQLADLRADGGWDSGWEGLSKVPDRYGYRP